MELRGKLLYLAYPYHSDPERRMREVVEIARRVHEAHPEAVLVVPHLLTDGLKGFLSEVDIAYMDLAILARCDVLVLCDLLDYRVSPGMVWEAGFARLLGIHVLTLREVLRGEG